MPHSPKVSVLLPAYNASAFLARAVRSVQAQTMPDWELLIVDDASRDATARQAKALAAQDPRIRVFVLAQNGGAAAARNHALAAARGRYIAFLDADDEWLADKLAAQLDHLAATGAVFCYSAFWRVIGARRRRVDVPERVSRAALLRGNVIGCLTALYDSAALGKVPMPDLPLSHDYALWLELLAQTEAVGVTRPLAIYHRQAGSLSANPWRSAGGTWVMLRRHFHMGRLASARCLSHHLLRRLRRG